MSTRHSLTAALVLVLSAVSIEGARGQSANQKREAAYQKTLQVYTEALKPGMTRTDVEDYLRAKGASFHQMCCSLEWSAFADLVKIGQEKHPWYCSEHNVYIAFLFTAIEAHDVVVRINDSDVLKQITIFHQLEGCL